MNSKYFCSICNRKCYDKNGLKCHLNSATHKKNLEKISKDPMKYIEEYSNDFLFGFIDIIKRLYSDQWVSVNTVYDEYIKDKDSVGLCNTKWDTLNNFIMFIKDKGLVKIRPTDNDLFVFYLQSEPKKTTQKPEHKHKTEHKKTETPKNKETKTENPNRLQKEKLEGNINDFKNVSISFNLGKEIKQKNFLGKKRENEPQPSPEKRDPSKVGTEEKEADCLVMKNGSWISPGLKVQIIPGKEKGLVRVAEKDKDTCVIFLKSTGKEAQVEKAKIIPAVPSMGSQCKVICGEHVGEVGIIIEEKKSEEDFISFKSLSSKKVYKIRKANLCKYKPK